MGSLESNTCTFVVNIWVDADSRDAASDEVVWRGEIRSVMGGESERVVFDSLDDLPALIQPYLEARGVQF